MEENYENVDDGSINVHSTDGDTSEYELNDDEDNSNSASSVNDSSDDGDDGDDADDGDDGDDAHDGDDGDDAGTDEGITREEFVSINAFTSDEIRAMEFRTVEEAYNFYCRYGKCKGFGVRKSDKRTKGPLGSEIIVMRQFVCSSHGLRAKKHLGRVDRIREHRRLTRTNCEARFRVHYKPKKERYVVSIFVEAHNHELTPSRYVHLHPVYRKFSEVDRAQVEGLQARGIRTCHIMGYMVALKGGYDRVGFIKKDLYNLFDKKMRAIVKDGDVAASLNYLNVKSSTDSMLFAEYAVDTSDGRLKTLFWADGHSRTDYFCFGDVLAFDTTYRRNKYNYPLVIFSGCNHHSQTVIFGAALVSDETIETYKWVLSSFLKCMQKKHPKAVVTDGDGAMREAIKQVFPDATHRLCSWHLNRNAGENVKKSAFLEGFQKAMHGNFTTVEFEEYWSEMIKENELEGNAWVAKTYENKSMWATAYLRDQFFGRIRTTSQCEAINAIIKSYAKKNGTIYEFMHTFDQALSVYRNNELVADFKSKFSEPVLTTHLKLIERDAGRIYTAEIFNAVKHEIMKAPALIVKDKLVHGDTKIYQLTKYCQDKYQRSVVYDGTTFQCSCRLFEHRGLPCSHMFYVMKEEHVDHIPTSLVLSRWTKDAKIEYMNMGGNGSIDSDTMEEARFSAYSSVFAKFCKEAAKKEGVYGEILDDIMKLQKKYCNDEDGVATKKSDFGVRDPTKINGKGAPKKKKNGSKSVKHCSKCNSTTHNARKCPGTKKRKRADEDDDVLPSVSLSDTFSHNDKLKNMRKTGCNGQSSVQERPEKRGANVTTRAHMDVASTSTQFTPMHGVEPLKPMAPPVMQTHVQPVHPNYGTQVGENSNSCFGLLQQVMNSAAGNASNAAVDPSVSGTARVATSVVGNAHVKPKKGRKAKKTKKVATLVCNPEINYAADASNAVGIGCGDSANVEPERNNDSDVGFKAPKDCTTKGDNDANQTPSQPAPSSTNEHHVDGPMACTAPEKVKKRKYKALKEVDLKNVRRSSRIQSTFRTNAFKGHGTNSTNPLVIEDEDVDPLVNEDGELDPEEANCLAALKELDKLIM